MLLSKIANLLGYAFYGEDKELDSMNELALAQGSQLTFAVSKKHSLALSSSSAGAFLIPSDLIQFLPQNSSYIVCENVSLSMAHATKLFAPKPIDFEAPHAKIGEASYIDAMSRVENGANIGAHVTIMAGAYIGSKVTIKENTIM